MRFTIKNWADDKTNEEVWVKLMSESGGKLIWNPFQENEYENLARDFAYLPFDTAQWSKCKKVGYIGFVDTLENVYEITRSVRRCGCYL